MFSVRTPTAIVTDLGTEFGVEVERSGTTRSHVFQGRIELRRPGTSVARLRQAARGASKGGGGIQLGENESATVEASQGRAAKVIRGTGPSSPPVFVRHMPQRVPIRVFSTGLGLREGDPDPHWQIVAWSGDPKFKPQAAVVAISLTAYLENDPARAQWISTARDLPNLPAGRFTFRTTFDLAGASPESAVLQGWFIADNHVDAIRLNGHAVSVPQHRSNPPFDTLHTFTAGSGFVEGTNVLEIEVYNCPAHERSEEDRSLVERESHEIPADGGRGGRSHGAASRIAGICDGQSTLGVHTPWDEMRPVKRPLLERFCILPNLEKCP